MGGCECEGREGAGLEPDVRLRARGCGRVFARGLAEARTAEAAGPRARRAIPTPDTTRRDAFNPPVLIRRVWVSNLRITYKKKAFFNFCFFMVNFL